MMQKQWSRVVFTLFSLFILASFASVHGQQDERLTQFEQIIQDEMAYYNVPGAAVAVISGDEVIYAQGFGFRDIENELPFTTETRFRIGSTTKSMTSFMIAQLVDEGLLAWNTPVSEILPEFATADPALTEQITLRDLMGMATGLVSDDLGAMGWGSWDFQHLLDVVAAQTIDGEFRNSHHYNNEVYALAGYTGVIASGLDPTLANYKALIQERVFDPIGMESAIITDDHAQLGENYAEPYELDLLGEPGDLSRMIDPPIALITPAGGVWMDIEDMAKYVITQMNGGGAPDGMQIVSAENLAETWQPGALMHPDDEMLTDVHYAMGWVTQNYRRVPMRWHNGGWSGYFTQMVVYPDSDTALLIFSNSSFGGTFNDTLVYAFTELWHSLDVTFVDLMHEQFAPQLSQIEQIRGLMDAEIDAETAAPLVGTYESGWGVEYHADDSSLWMTQGAWMYRLAYVDVLDQYLVINNGGLGAVVDFNTLRDPASLTLNVGGAESYTFEKVE